MTLFGLVPSDPAWAKIAAADLPATLADHFHCERKAAASALSLVRLYPGRKDLTLKLALLANEETRHLLQVQRELDERGFVLRHDLSDLYAAALRKQVRKTEPERQLDLLLVSALIEARSAERLGLLGETLAEPLGAFYRKLAQAEVRHAHLFIELARPIAPAATFELRLAELVSAEAKILGGLPMGPRIH